MKNQGLCPIFCQNALTSMQQYMVEGALEVTGEEMDYIQAELYKRSTKVVKRMTGMLYNDCMNYFLEIEQEEGL